MCFGLGLNGTMYSRPEYGRRSERRSSRDCTNDFEVLDFGQRLPEPSMERPEQVPVDLLVPSGWSCPGFVDGFGLSDHAAGGQ